MPEELYKNKKRFISSLILGIFAAIVLIISFISSDVLVELANPKDAGEAIGFIFVIILFFPILLFTIGLFYVPEIINMVILSKMIKDPFEQRKLYAKIHLIISICLMVAELIAIIVVFSKLGIGKAPSTTTTTLNN